MVWNGEAASRNGGRGGLLFVNDSTPPAGWARGGISASLLLGYPCIYVYNLIYIPLTSATASIIKILAIGEDR